MKLIEWQSDFNTGINEIDEQHKKLVDILNTLFDAIQQDKEGVIYKNILQDLIDYIKFHFETEEGLMIKHEYPDFQKHRQYHDYLTKQVMTFYQEEAENAEKLSIDLLVFLKRWLEDHILGTDMQFGYFVKNKNN